MSSDPAGLSADVRRLCKEAGFPTTEGRIRVEFPNGRRHALSILEVDDETLRIEAIVCRPAALVEVDQLPLRVWRRNRGTRLVSFRLDHRGAVRGHAWVPRAGLTAAELETYVRAVAAECDRFEFLLTGEDRE